MTSRLEAKSVEKGSVTSDVFIVGMSRSGTTWLAESLNSHPEITVFGESAFWGRRYVRPHGNEYSSKDYRRMVTVYQTEAARAESDTGRYGWARVFTTLADEARRNGSCLTPAEFYRRACQQIGEINGSSLVIEKTPHHVNWISRITKSLPDARFLVCIRNPYDFLLSYKHQGDRKPERVRQMFQALYHPIVTSTVARQYLKAFRSLVDKYPDRTFLVRLEEVDKDPERVLRSIQKFLNVEPHRQLDAGRVNTSFPRSSRPTLADEDVLWLNLVAGSQIKGAGYERRPSTRPSPAALWPLITLPVALWHAGRITSRATADSLYNYLRGWFSLND